MVSMHDPATRRRLAAVTGIALGFAIALSVLHSATRGAAGWFAVILSVVLIMSYAGMLYSRWRSRSQGRGGDSVGAEPVWRSVHFAVMQAGWLLL